MDAHTLFRSKYTCPWLQQCLSIAVQNRSQGKRRILRSSRRFGDLWARLVINWPQMYNEPGSITIFLSKLGWESLESRKKRRSLITFNTLGNVISAIWETYHLKTNLPRLCVDSLSWYLLKAFFSWIRLSKLRNIPICSWFHENVVTAHCGFLSLCPPAVSKWCNHRSPVHVNKTVDTALNLFCCRVLMRYLYTGIYLMILIVPCVRGT